MRKALKGNKWLAGFFWFGVSVWILLISGAFFAPAENPAHFSWIADKSYKMDNETDFSEEMGWDDENWRDTYQEERGKLFFAVEMEDQTDILSKYYSDSEYSHFSNVEVVYTYATVGVKTYGCYMTVYYTAYKANFSYLDQGWEKKDYIGKYFKCGELRKPVYG